MFKSINVRDVYERTVPQSVRTAATKVKFKACKIWENLPPIWKKLAKTCLILMVCYLALKLIAGFWVSPLTPAEQATAEALHAKWTSGAEMTISEKAEWFSLFDKSHVWSWTNWGLFLGAGATLVATVTGVISVIDD